MPTSLIRYVLLTLNFSLSGGERRWVQSTPEILGQIVKKKKKTNRLTYKLNSYFNVIPTRLTNKKKIYIYTRIYEYLKSNKV